MSTCVQRVAVDAHFSEKASPEDERSMRAHLRGCAECRAYYARRALLAKLDPTAARAEDRIAAGLGIAGERKGGSVLRFVAPVAGALLAAAAVLFFLRAPRGDGFTPRGDVLEATAPASHVTVYRVPAGAKPTPALDVVGRRDELAFVYDNAAEKRYLMIFAVDDRRAVYWFHPAWTREAQDPQAVPIEPGSHELPEAVAHSFEGSSLEIHALFLDKPATVRHIEAMLSRTGGRVDLPGAIDHVQTVRLTP
jgi:hypothetical protein